MEMQERIKAIRKHVGMTQAEFAISLGLGPYSSAAWEKKDAQIPTESMQLLICKTFGINKHWLETGEGEMVDTVAENKLLVERILKDRAVSPSVIKLLDAWASLPDPYQRALEDFAEQYAASYRVQQPDSDDEK